MILTDDEIRVAASKWVAETDYKHANATSFAAGVKFLQQKLQQCGVSRADGPLPHKQALIDILQHKAGFAEYNMQHNYRLMYSLWNDRIVPIAEEALKQGGSGG